MKHRPQPPIPDFGAAAGAGTESFAGVSLSRRVQETRYWNHLSDQETARFARALHRERYPLRASVANSAPVAVLDAPAVPERSADGESGDESSGDGGDGEPAEPELAGAGLSGVGTSNRGGAA
ncbi:MAG: hypothetical protein U0167_19550 [bacterium]